jgi:nucleotide-binding universal stress UspA family protein
MINQILIPTDFSSVAVNALLYAIEVAKKSGASLHVLHVKQVPMADVSYPADAYQQFLTELNQLEQLNLKKLEEQYLKNASVKYQYHSAMGFVVDEILDYSTQHEIDLVIMGTTGASGIAELLIGSNAASVIGKSSIPVLVIPPNHAYKNINHILYSTDYTEPEEPAVRRMMYIAELYDSKITVVHVKTEYDNYFNAKNNFFVKNKAEFEKHEVNILNLQGEDVAQAIDSCVNDFNIDLLVMAKHKRGFFDRLFHRSMSKQMAYHSKVPLLVVQK